MTTPDILDLVGFDVRKLPEPAADLVPKNFLEDYTSRRDALLAVAGGMSLRAAADLYEVDARTVGRDAVAAMEAHADGNRVGMRACLPYKNRRPKKVKIPRPFDKGGPHAMQNLLHSDSRLKELVDGYRGALPNGKVKCRAFDRHAGMFRKLVREIHGDHVFVFKQEDQGRRALLAFHKALRKERLEAGGALMDEVAPTTRTLGELIAFRPLERIEFDAHKLDVEMVIEIVRPDDQVVTKQIREINLVVAICAVSRYLLGYVLVIGAYNRLDVLRLFHRILVPWTPRTLIVPTMRYPEGACLGLPTDANGSRPRGVLIAGDNAMSHHADLALDGLLEHHRGIVNLGRAHVPEGRPIVEAFNRRLEQGALRSLPGSFQPEHKGGPKTSTTYLRSGDHPVHWEGFSDLMDVICAGHNVTPHSGLGNRTPTSALLTHLGSGWSWRATEAARDAKRLTTIRINPRIRGDKASGRHPFVEYQGAYYRSKRLMGRWDRVGTRMIGEVDMEDLRHLVLLDTDGTPYSKLDAMPPWSATRHDLHLRQQINRARSRGLLEIVGSEDAIDAWRTFTLSQTLTGGQSVDAHARVQTHSPRAPSPSAKIEVPRFAVQPRAGRATFAHRKD